MSFEEVLDEDTASIAEHGFAVIGVEDPDGPHAHPPWCYTVGLLDAADHPEMIITGVPTSFSRKVLSVLAAGVLDGERYEVGDITYFGGGHGATEIGAVNDVQYELGTFNMWHQCKARGAVRATRLRAVQIILPPEFFCSDHGESQPLLGDPETRVGTPSPRPNRAYRRAHRPRRRAG
jgi:Domain of unknown function (DUF4262)